MPPVIFVLLFTLAPATLAGNVHIAVAANFKQTALAINYLFENSTGHQTTFSSASTGVLHSQITHGAPFDVFLAADTHSPESLATDGYAAEARFCYARGQLALVGGSGSLTDLNNPELSLAIANPVTAPYGRAALELLDRPEYNSGQSRKIVRANNVLQAYQYWHSNSVDMALVARALAPEESIPIPASLHAPLEQQAILLIHAADNPAALGYVNFLQSEAAQSLIGKAGYGNCE